MATTVIQTDGTSIKISKPSHIYLQPYVDSALDTNIYDLDNVLKDSTKLTQDDNSESNIESETSDSPIMVITTLGNRKFECTIEDMQEDILTKFCGFKLSTDKTTLFAPVQYVDMFCQVTVVCDYGTKHFAYVMPYLKLNSKLLAESLSTAMGGVSVAGTAMDKSVTIGGDTKKCSLYTVKDFTLPTATP